MVDVIEKLRVDTKRLTREVSQLKTKLAMSGGGGEQAGFDVVEAGGVKLARAKSTGLDKDARRSLADSMKNAIKSGVVLVTSTNDDGTASIVVSVTADLTKRIAAGRLVKELAPIVGGGGGGRPDFAEAGGKVPSRSICCMSARPKCSPLFWAPSEGSPNTDARLLLVGLGEASLGVCLCNA